MSSRFWLGAGMLIALFVNAEAAPVRMNGVEIDAPAARLSVDESLPLQHVLIQYRGPRTTAQRSQDRAFGVNYLDFIPPHAYIAEASPDALRLLALDEEVEWIRQTPGEAKIAQGLRKAFLSEPVISTLGEAKVSVNVVFYPDISFEDAAVLLDSLGADLNGKTGFDFRASLFEIALPVARLSVLAADDRVRSIDEIEPPLAPLNADAQDTSNVDEIHPGGIAGYNLDGSGVTLGEWDVGPALDIHEQLKGRVINQDYETASEFHSTHVAGTIIASGDPDPRAQGMAPGARLLCWNYYNDLSEIALNYKRITASNHSYGYSYTEDGVTLARPKGLAGTLSYSLTPSYGLYTERTRSWDWIASEYNHIIVSAAGNNQLKGAGPSRADSNDASGARTMSLPNAASGSGYDTIMSTATGKNIITVGAVQDLDSDPPQPVESSMTDFSSWGPTDDGRIKPDIVANGYKLYSTGNISDDAYAYQSGTSMAAPVVTGTIGCLTQLYRQVLGGEDPSLALMKGLLIHTAIEAGETVGPDYRFGWGLLNARAAADFLSSLRLGLRRLAIDSIKDDPVEYSAQYGGAGPIKVTLIWNDPPALPSYGSEIPALVNDLDLKVIGPDGEHYPWTLNPLRRADAAKRVGANHVDTVEQVWIDTPQAGAYRIEVGGAVNLGASQQFVLLMDGLVLTNDEPNVALLSPFGGGQTDGVADVMAWVPNAESMRNISLMVNGVSLSPVTVKNGVISASWDTTQFNDGLYEVSAAAVDGNGIRKESRCHVIVQPSDAVVELFADGVKRAAQVSPIQVAAEFIFQPTESGVYTIETFPAGQGAETDTVLFLQGERAGRRYDIAKDDDAGVNTYSLISTQLEGGAIYHIRCDTFDRSYGVFLVGVSSGESGRMKNVKPITVNQPRVTSQPALDIGDPYWYSFTSRASESPYVTHNISLISESAYARSVICSLYDTSGGQSRFVESWTGPSHESGLKSGSEYELKVQYPKTSVGHSIRLTAPFAHAAKTLLTDGTPTAFSFDQEEEPQETWFEFHPDKTSIVWIQASSKQQNQAVPQIDYFYLNDGALLAKGKVNRDRFTGGTTYYVRASAGPGTGDYEVAVDLNPYQNAVSNPGEPNPRQQYYDYPITVTRSFSSDHYISGELVDVVLKAFVDSRYGIESYTIFGYETFPPDWYAIDRPRGLRFGSYLINLVQPRKTAAYSLLPSETSKGPVLLQTTIMVTFHILGSPYEYYYYTNVRGDEALLPGSVEPTAVFDWRLHD